MNEIYENYMKNKRIENRFEECENIALVHQKIFEDYNISRELESMAYADGLELAYRAVYDIATGKLSKAK